MTPQIKTRLNYEVIRDGTTPDTWRVEAIDYEDDGQVYTAIFTGPEARERAEEYAAFKNGT